MVSGFQAELYRGFHIVRREPLQFLVGTALLVVFFFAYRAGLHFTSSDMEPLRFVRSATTLYVMWIIISNGLTYAAGEIEKDVNAGVIERIFISGRSLHSIIFFRSILGIAHTVLTTCVLYLGLWLVTGVGVEFSIELFVGAIITTMVGVGLGFLAAGLALHVRPVFAVLMPLQLLLLFMLSVPLMLPDGSVKQILSLALPAGPLAMAPGGIHAGTLPAAVANAAGYLAIGWLAFHRLEQRARLCGNMGR
ncbi:hypothetical protein GE253_19635 [Niveispirillum sp. SYP-B3756]|uniref:hypothetical protein n=1 Tax=Niveispirillum sp. SYP-B3756 TaxID=2662178 RepID=UPI0012926505|nr:hypothetical protein [Niveispirillum sp. SYP-B3756]MQP67541.1 hypothetical protein [Niveispirillum sp. SYP-B3756]